jgi:hypothetical protein
VHNTGQPAARRHNDVMAGRNPRAGFDPHTYLLHDLPPDLVQLLNEGPDEEPAESLFGQPFPLSAWPQVTTVVLAGRDDRLFPLAFQRRIARDRLGRPVTVMNRGGIYSHLASIHRGTSCN